MVEFFGFHGGQWTLQGCQERWHKKEGEANKIEILLINLPRNSDRIIFDIQKDGYEITNQYFIVLEKCKNGNAMTV